MLFPIKSEAETLQEMMDEVLASTTITDMSAGSIARTLLEVFNRRLGACYRYFDTYTSMSFLSTAAGMYLDMIGQMLGCTRLADEIDDNYRYRISKQVTSAATANTTAIRLGCLSVIGVKDVIITPYARGNGSFTVHVITDEIDTPSDVLSAVTTVVTDIKAEGIRAVVAKPVIVPIDIRFNIIPRDGVTIGEATIGGQIKEAVSSYVDTVPMGGTVSILEILRAAQTNEYISQAYINSIYIDDKAVIAESQYPLEWDERAYVNSVIIT